MVGLVDLRVAQHLDDLHRAGGLHRPVQRLVQEEPPAFLRPVDTLTNPGAEQAVAAPQVVIEEAERRPDREGVQPQRHFGQLDRHRILVHAVHTSLQHHAPDHVTVVELLGLDGPALRVGVAKDGVANGVDVLHQRRDIPLQRALRFGHGGNHPIRQVIHEADQEVTRTHGRIADLEIEQPAGRIEAFQLRQPEPEAPPALAELLRFRGESLEPGAHQRPDRLFENQAHELVRGVVAARALACEDVRADDDLVPFARDLVLQEALVDRAELLDAQVAVVDVSPTLRPASNDSASMTSAMTRSPSLIRERRGALSLSKSPPS